MSRAGSPPRLLPCSTLHSKEGLKIQGPGRNRKGRSRATGNSRECGQTGVKALTTAIFIKHSEKKKNTKLTVKVWARFSRGLGKKKKSLLAKGKKYPWATDGTQTSHLHYNPWFMGTSLDLTALYLGLWAHGFPPAPSPSSVRLPSVLPLDHPGPTETLVLSLPRISGGPWDLRCIKHYAHTSQQFSSCWMSGSFTFQKAWRILNATPFYKWNRRSL